MIYALLGIAIIVLIILLIRKHHFDFTNEIEERSRIQNEINKLKLEKEQLDDTLNQRDEAIQQADEAYRKKIEQYNIDAYERYQGLNQLISDRKKEIEEDYLTLIEAKRELYNRELEEWDRRIYEEWSGMYDKHIVNCQNLEKQENQIQLAVQNKQADYENLIAPFKLIEQEQQEKLFWCIQIPEVEREDIHFLLTTVAPQVRNRDIIPKLVWSEYIQKPTQELMKRVGIDDNPGIYKITNVKTNKCYVGKSTKVRQRLIDHIKGAIGISTIADQRIHHAMLDEGLWNWTFEKICDCEKDELSEKEKYYISFFKSQEWGYNIASGG